MLKRMFAGFVLTAMAAAQMGSSQPASGSKPAGQAAQPAETVKISTVLGRQMGNIQKMFSGAADVMPEEKFAFKPSEGEFKTVRTYGAQVKHVATANYMIAAAILGEKPPVDIGDPMKGEDGPTSLTTKADIMRYLKDSYEYSLKALASIESEEKALGTVKSPFGAGTPTRLALATMLLSHNLDHYGQMVIYLRMNSIVPPASRGNN